MFTSFGNPIYDALLEDALAAGVSSFTPDIDDDTTGSATTTTAPASSSTSQVMSRITQTLYGIMMGEYPLSGDEKALAEARGEFVRALENENARPNDAVRAFKAAIPSPALHDQEKSKGSLSGVQDQMAQVSTNAMAAASGKIGIVVTEGRQYHSGNLSKVLAQSMYALGIMGEPYSACVCLLAEHLDPNAKETYRQARVDGIVDDLGFEIVYDPDSILDDGKPDISEGSVYCEGGVLKLSVEAVKDNPRARKLVYNNTIAQLSTALSNMSGADPYPSSRSFVPRGSTVVTDADRAESVIACLDTMSYGLTDAFDALEEKYSSDEFSSISHYALPAPSSFGLDAASKVFSGMRDEAALETAAGVCRIWKEEFAQYGWSPQVMHLFREGKLAELGDKHGMHAKMEAFLVHGVPAEDIVAAS